MGDTLSVCMPVYNGQEFLPRAFESLALQTFRDFELIIVDDGSTDDSANIASRLMSEHHLKGQVISTPNHGPEQARDIAIKHSHGNIIAQMDCDDCWDSAYLSQMLAVLEQTPEAGLVYCDLVEEFPDGRKLTKSETATWIDTSLAAANGDVYLFPCPLFFKMLLSGQVLFPPCTVYRKALYERAGPYTKRSQELRISLDWDFGLRASRIGSIAFLKRPLLRKYIHGGNVSRDISRTVACGIQVLRWTLADPTLADDERNAARARGALIAALASYGSWEGDHKQWQAFRWALVSLKFRPTIQGAKMLLLSLIPRMAAERLKAALSG